jgi:hypothetical protein
MQPITMEVGFRIGEHAQWSELFSAAQPVIALPGVGPAWVSLWQVQPLPLREAMNHCFRQRQRDHGTVSGYYDVIC